MVAMKRDDGLYDLPGLGFPVPLEYVPEAHRPPTDDLYNQEAVPPPAGPDERLADNGGFQNRTGQPIDLNAPERKAQEAQAQSDAKSSFFEHPPTGEQLAAYQRPQAAAGSPKVMLEPGPGEAAGGASAERTPMDKAFEQQVLRSMRGSYTPGGDRMVAQQWLNQNEAVNPSERKAPALLTDPETGELQTRLVEHPGVSGIEEAIYQGGAEKVDPSVRESMMAGYEPGTVPGAFSAARHYPGKSEQVHPIGLNYEPGKPESFEAVPVVGTGAEEFANREARQKMLEAQAAEQAQGAMRREARRDLNAGRYLQGAAEEEKADLDKARAEYDQQKGELDNIKAQIQHIAKTLPEMAAQHSVPPETKSHFALAIAQGLMVAGGRPFVNLVREAIQDDFQREQAMMHWALQGKHVQLGALSTLAHLTAQMRDPVAAAHAFAALRWQQAQHQLEAFNVQAMGGRKSDEAAQMDKQMEVAKQHELKQALGSVHTRQWATVPGQSTPGGIPGLERWVDQNFKDKKQAHQVRQHIYGQMAKGEALTFPRFDENGQITRTDEKIGEQAMSTAVRIPEWLDQRQPVLHTHHPGEGDKARAAFDAAETGEMLLKEAEGILSHAGARLDPTKRAQLAAVMTQMLSVVKNFDKDGTLKIAELPILEKRSGYDAIMNMTNLANAQEMIDFSRRIIRKSAASQAGVSQMTRSPGGSDYWNKGATQQGKNFFRPYGGTVEGVTEE